VDDFISVCGSGSRELDTAPQTDGVPVLSLTISVIHLYGA
jgi:hypothetical protein